MKTERRRWARRLAWWMVALAIASAIAYGLAPKPIEVITVEVDEGPLEVTVEDDGRTRLRDRYVLSAPLLGSAARISLRPGDWVERGAHITTLRAMNPSLLDPRTRAELRARVAVAEANRKRAQAQVLRAQAALRFTQSEAQRVRVLRQSQGQSAQALERAEFELRAATDDLATVELAVRVADSELSAARVALGTGNDDDAPIWDMLAPASGVVLRVYQEHETVVQPGTPLVEIGDPRSLEVVVDVLSSDAVRIQQGAEARIVRWGGDAPLRARVRRKEPSAFTTHSALGVEEQRVPIVLDFLEPAETIARLSDGYRVEASIRVSFLERAVRAPASAVFREESGFFAFAVRDGRARRVPLTVGARTPDRVAIEKGLHPRDEVIEYPSDQVRDGVRVTPRRKGPSVR